MFNNVLIVLFTLLIVSNIKCSTVPNVDRAKIQKFSKDKIVIDEGVNLDKSTTSDYSLYIDNVIGVIKSQQWSTEEAQCLKDILLMLNSVKNSTFWAVWKWDSMITNPFSVLYGTRYQLGNFDQCLSSLWLSEDPTLQSQYCLVDVKLEGDKQNKSAQDLFQPIDPFSPAKNFLNSHVKHTRPADTVAYGACLPGSCSPNSVEKLVSALVISSSIGIQDMPITVRVGGPCQTGSKKEFDLAFCAYITIALILLLTTIICTFVFKNKSQCNSIKMRLIGAFSLESNSKNLLVMKSGGLDVLYGIRFLTICLIVLGHQMGIYNGGGPTINGRMFDEDAMSTLGHIFLHFDVFVDTFYMMSGLLTVSNFLSMTKPPNVILLILKRYIRLAAGLAVIVFYMCSVFSYTGSGPLWPQLIEHEQGPCRRNWWLSLLMINNYINSNDICIVISWYVPTDFQFFLVAVVLWCLYRRCKKFAIAIATLLAVASIVTNGVLHYMYNLSPTQLLTYEFLLNQRDNREFNLTYIKAHTRFAAYYIGLVAGYILTKTISNENRKRWPLKWSLPGALFGMFIMTTVMVTGGHLVTKEVTPLESAIYAALNRPAWALGLVIFIFCCCLGSVPVLSSFLSWYPWVPLSRLSYGLYLTHTLIILRDVFISRQPQYMDTTHILVESSGVIVWGSIAALVMWLLVEAPINNLLTICISPRHSNSAGTEMSADNIQNKTNDTNGHLRDNLSSNIQISKI